MAAKPLQPIGPRDPRIIKHLKAFAEAGQDPESFAVALRAFRDDALLSAPQRAAIFKSMAQDAVLAYYALATGQPFDLGPFLSPATPHDKP